MKIFIDDNYVAHTYEGLVEMLYHDEEFHSEVAKDFLEQFSNTDIVEAMIAYDADTYRNNWLDFFDEQVNRYIEDEKFHISEIEV